jgi:transglutaminase-like putative cysteine protease
VHPNETPCDTIRTLYDYVADTLTYNGYESGDVGALRALETGRGDCTEFADLLAALSRASGIPARGLEGVSCCTNQGYVEGQNKHDWLEVYLPGSGWVPMDPIYGKNQGNRDSYFAAMPANRIIVTRGRNLEALSGYHYYSYRYWYEGEKPSFTVRETWSIIRRDTIG